MARKLITLSLIVVVFAITMHLFAYADVLIEPGNDFFDRHINKIEYLRREFYANGSGGFVSVKTEPGSNNEIAQIENGGIHQIQYTYNNHGEIWGVLDVEVPGKPYQEWQRGWVLMDDVLVVYDTFSFEDEYKDEIYTYTGSIDILFEGHELVFWKYPGSGVVTGSWDESVLSDPNRDFRTWWDEYPAYTDADNREWIAFPILVKEWICLSDPTNNSIPAFNPPPEPELWQPGETLPAQSGNFTVPILIVSLVIALVIVTFFLIRILWKKAKTEPNSPE